MRASKMKTFLTATAAVVAFATTANASTTGTVVGLFSGNDPFPGNLVITNRDIDSPALYKCDNISYDDLCTDTNGSVSGENYADGDFTISFDTCHIPRDYTVVS